MGQAGLGINLVLGIVDVASVITGKGLGPGPCLRGEPSTDMLCVTLNIYVP